MFRKSVIAGAKSRGSSYGGEADKALYAAKRAGRNQIKIEPLESWFLNRKYFPHLVDIVSKLYMSGKGVELRQAQALNYASRGCQVILEEGSAVWGGG